MKLFSQRLLRNQGGATLSH